MSKTVLPIGSDGKTIYHCYFFREYLLLSSCRPTQSIRQEIILHFFYSLCLKRLSLEKTPVKTRSSPAQLHSASNTDLLSGELLYHPCQIFEALIGFGCRILSKAFSESIRKGRTIWIKICIENRALRVPCPFLNSNCLSLTFSLRFQHMHAWEMLRKTLRAWLIRLIIPKSV